TAQEALDWGLVNEIVPKDKLLTQSWAMARYLMQRPREVRAFTTAIARQRLRSALSRDLPMHLTHQIAAALMHPVAIQSQREDIVTGDSGYFEME
ncbi:MAG: hypothetical protein EOP21_10235, partial [Hyphomicrobiales bacterium]